MSDAASENHVSVVRYLLHHGANILDQNKFQRTAFEEAASLGHVNVVEAMIVDGQLDLASEHGRRALNMAAAENHQSTVQVLLRYGVRVNPPAEATNQDSALMYAATQGATNIVRMLLDHNANINSVDGKGDTPLMNAVTNNKIPVVKILLENGAHVMNQDKDGDTALMLAASLRYNQVIALLIQYGGLSQLHVRNHSGQTALMMAEEWGNDDTAALLRSAAETGADEPL